MIAALPMYDRPETAGANDRFWGLIRETLGQGPTHLTRDQDVWEIWCAPELVFAQTCGLPYRTKLHGHVTLIGTPDYGLPNCPPGYYYSVFVVASKDTRTDVSDFENSRFAYNEAGSQSGWAAPVTHALERGISFQQTIASGGHRESARMVANGQADIAALDVLSWRMIDKYDDFARNLKIIARTKPTPTLPYIAHRDANRHATFSATSKAIFSLSNADRETLSIVGLVDISAQTYLDIPTPSGPKFS